MRSLMKPTGRWNSQMTSSLARVLFIAISAVFAPGCAGTRETGKANPRPTQQPSQALIIESTPFSEMNGKEVYNASGVIPLADSRFLFCDNNTGDALFELNLTPDGLKKGSLIRRPLRGLPPEAVDDFEDMTLVEEGGRRYVFITSSMSVKKAKKDSIKITPSGLLRVTINPDDSLSAENMPGFRDWLISAYPQLATSAKLEPDDGGLNIEALAWDGGRGALLFGLRSPVPDGRPLILPVKVKDLAGQWATSNLEAQSALQLTVESTLGEQGVRGLCYDSGRNAFLVIMGKSISHSGAPFLLYEWSGNADGATRRLNAGFANKMKPEGLTRGTIGGKGALVIVDDNGGFRVVWDDKHTLSEAAPG